MNQNTAIVLVVAVVSVGAALLLWLMARSKRKRRSTGADYAARFAKRLESPDFDGLERHLGHALPASFRAMYTDRALVMDDNVVIDIPNPVSGEDECYVASFEPADVESLGLPWPGCEGLFPIAGNGCGDEFLVDLREADPHVLYHLHETGEKGRIGVTLSQFIAAPRKPVSEE